MRLLACRLVANLHTLKSMLSPRAGFHTAGGPAKLSGGRPRPKDLAFTQPGKAPAKRSKYAWTWPSPCETNLGGSLVIPRVCSNPGSNKSFCFQSISRDFKQYARTPLGLEGSNGKKQNIHPCSSQTSLGALLLQQGRWPLQHHNTPDCPIDLSTSMRRMNGPASSAKMGKEVASYWSYSTELPEKNLQTRPEQKVEFQITQPMVRQCLMKQ